MSEQKCLYDQNVPVETSVPPQGGQVLLGLKSCTCGGGGSVLERKGKEGKRQRGNCVGVLDLHTASLEIWTTHGHECRGSLKSAHEKFSWGSQVDPCSCWRDGGGKTQMKRMMRWGQGGTAAMIVRRDDGRWCSCCLSCLDPLNPQSLRKRQQRNYRPKNPCRNSYQVKYVYVHIHQLYSFIQSLCV